MSQWRKRFLVSQMQTCDWLNARGPARMTSTLPAAASAADRLGLIGVPAALVSRNLIGSTGQRGRVHGRHRAVWFGHVSAALSPGRAWGKPDAVGPADVAADGGRARRLDRERTVDHALR